MQQAEQAQRQQGLSSRRREHALPQQQSVLDDEVSAPKPLSKHSKCNTILALMLTNPYVQSWTQGAHLHASAVWLLLCWLAHLLHQRATPQLLQHCNTASCCCWSWLLLRAVLSAAAAAAAGQPQ
jgi:hypothetical protein